MRYDITSARHKAKMEKLLGQDPLNLDEELALLRLLIDEEQKVALDENNLNVAEKEEAKKRAVEWTKTVMQGAKTAQQIQKNSNQLIHRDVLIAQLGRFLLVVKAATDHLPDKGQIMANIGEGIMEIARELRNTETVTIEAHNNGRITQQALEQQDDSP